VDIEQPAELLAYLRAHGRIGPAEEPRCEVLSGGVSNRVVRLQRPNGETWVLKQSLAKLRVPVDWFSPPERIHREALGLRWLAELAPPGTITPLVFEDHEHHLLAMQAVPEPHENWKAMLLGGHLRIEHVEQFGRLLAAIHRRGAWRRQELQPVFADRSYFESLRLEPYYLYSAVQVPEAADFLHELVAETRASALTVVHGDYSPKNILVYEDRLILLDHEVIHFGEPAFDLGFSLAHLFSKAHHVVHRRTAFLEAILRYWKAYRDEAGEHSARKDRVIRHALGCLLARVAGRSQLEYLSSEEKLRQRRAVLALLRAVPCRLPELVEGFHAQLCQRSNA
jgi:5-methylthioribose kinase